MRSPTTLPWKLATAASVSVAVCCLSLALTRSPAPPRLLRSVADAPTATSPEAIGAAAPPAWSAPADDDRATKLVADLGRARTAHAKCNVIDALARSASDVAARAILDATLPYQREEVRTCSATALEHVAGVSARDRLVQIAGEGNRGLRAVAVEALARREDGRAWVEAFASSTDPKIAVPALVALGHAGAPGAAQRIANALASTHGAARGELVEALGATHDPSVVPSLIAMIQTAGDVDRASVFQALAEIGGTQAVGALKAALGKPRTTSHALAALAQLDDDDARQAILEVARSGRAHRGEALMHLLQVSETRDEARALCLRIAREENGSAAAEAIGALGQDTSPEATRALFAIAREGGRASGVAVQALAQRDDPGAVDGLLGFAESGNHRAAALGALATSGDPRALSALQRAAQSDDLRLRASAFRGLGQIGGPDAERVLLDASRDATPNVRRLTIAALSSHDSPGARARLSELARDADPQTASQALAVLVQSQQDEAPALVLEAWRAHPAMHAQLVALATQLPPENSRPLLEGALRDPDASVARIAVQQLAVVGEAGAESTLRAFAADPTTSRELAALVTTMLSAARGEAVQLLPGDATSLETVDVEDAE